MKNPLLALSSLLLLVACGGGGGGSSNDTDSASGAPTTDTSVILGTTARFEATRLSFGVSPMGRSKAMSVVLHNDGAAEADFSLMAGLPAGFRTQGCEAVPAGGSCELVVSFRPTAERVHVGSGIAPMRAENLTNRLSVSGRGFDACGLTLQVVDMQPQLRRICP